MNKCFFGDCRDSMRKLINDGVKVQMCVTSPPYFGLRDYGHDGQLGLEETPEQYIANMVEVFSLVRELLADDGVLWLNIGDSYASYRDGKATPDTARGDSNGTLVPKGCDRNRMASTFAGSGVKHKDLIGIPWMLAFALRADGWYLRQDIIWSKPNPMPESVTDRCTKAHEYIFLLSKSRNYYYDNEAIKEDSEWAGDPRAGYGRLHYRGKREGQDGTGQENFVHITEKRNKRSVWSVNVKPYSGAHFATYPEELIEPCILAGSKVGDIVLDPFLGSGTTGQVAQNLGRKWIGCELNQEYEELQNRRTEQMSFSLEIV